LSIIAKARPCIPPEVTASTGFVAVRIPNNPVALALLSAAKVPVAAPSANRFGHISPTTAEHVSTEFPDQEDLWILDGGSCKVGIESTVIKLALPEGQVIVLRLGGVTVEQLQECVRDLVPPLEAKLSSRIISQSGWKSGAVAPNKDEPSEAHAQEAPGMLLTHYSPRVPTYLLRRQAQSVPDSASTTESEPAAKRPKACSLQASECLLIDVAGTFADLSGSFAHCLSLCDSAEEMEAACSRVFATLRQAEAEAEARGCTCILVADFEVERADQAAAVFDRLFRAASGQRRWLVEGTGGAKPRITMRDS